MVRSIQTVWSAIADQTSDLRFIAVCGPHILTYAILICLCICCRLHFLIHILRFASRRVLRNVLRYTYPVFLCHGRQTGVFLTFFLFFFCFELWPLRCQRRKRSRAISSGVALQALSLASSSFISLALRLPPPSLRLPPPSTAPPSSLMGDHTSGSGIYALEDEEVLFSASRDFLLWLLSSCPSAHHAGTHLFLSLPLYVLYE